MALKNIPNLCPRQAVRTSVPCMGLGEAALPAALGSLATTTLRDRGCSELQGLEQRWAQHWLGAQKTHQKQVD